MRQALQYGNRLLIMCQGRIIDQIDGGEKAAMEEPALIERFRSAVAGAALAARLHGVPCVVAMLRDAVPRKVAMVRALGAEVAFVDGNVHDLFAHAEALVARRSLAYVHPCDDAAVIAGQGTIGLELLDEVAHLDVLLVPTGGGMLAGCALALEDAPRRVRLVGVEAAGAAKLAASLAAGRRVEARAVATVADGLAVGWYGERNFAVVRDRVDEVRSVSDEQMLDAMAAAWEHLRLSVARRPPARISAFNSRRPSTRPSPRSSTEPPPPEPENHGRARAVAAAS